MEYMEYKAVLFDLDGTLLNTLEDLGDTVNQILEKNGFPIHPIESYRFFVGEGATMLIKRALPESERNKSTLCRCIYAFNQLYEQNWNIKSKPYAGVDSMLDSLVAGGIRIGVLSNKPNAFAQKCVGEMLGKWKFDQVLGQQENLPCKPDPAGALEIARSLDFPPESFLYLGDTGIDMKTANAARMFAVGVLWGFRPREELQNHGAQALIEKPEELLHFWQ
jgi:phosphoglycolate phosphatase